ncbi:MAG: FKBP-type peptidyl-prolyl cis-trans isomerase [Bryobacteraceae bacterium]|nr:FKBP-type peptidyl-prolyl cis-trans isomerase [Bryobacteraceae bacterium]
MAFRFLLLLALPLAAQMPPAPGTPVERFAFRSIELAPGAGAAAEPGQEYTVHYTGWLRDGTKFDSSVDRKEPFKFVQGRRLVIAGWEAGFEGMRVGGKRRIFVPYAMAYGEKGRGKIPPKAELIFDVELLGVRAVPDVLAGADLLAPLNELERKILALADALPEAKYAWRPLPDMRSVSEMLVHIANGNELMLGLANGALTGPALEQQIAANASREKQPATKAAIRARLVASFAAVRKELEAARAGTLAQERTFFGAASTQRGVLAMLDTHVAEHLGQAINYARLCGIRPPWSGGN